MQDLKNNSLKILEFIWNNFDTFRELMQKNTTYFLWEFIAIDTETFI